ncbi:Glycosyltransferase, GT2 family [Catalinimonas alkaloidigena]|uniref:Glycosyltransferase, GT2 family n=1 Tax=Catalinimonas alkaloidigena TaxID=1075417 RepID=A0A1G9A1Q5_9BACT|nr:glycosyltransferase family 2 protein [Catalinimonas alkaloidigena]SDK21288.1 Glycosyltransferase, GT2 family [Catalinimonas alkaloidigena]
MKLSVVIVNYNVSYFLEQALLSVQKAARGLEVEVWVVDNNSVDGSVEMVRRRFPEVRLIANQENVGFSRANNQAIRQSTGEYVLLLNPDTVLEEDTLAKCCRFMDEHPDAGGLGIKMVDGQGTFLPESKRGLPTPRVAFYKVFGLSALFPRSRRFGRYHLGFLSADETHEVEVLSGAFMVLRRSVLDQIGLLDEDYFMYGEDIDLSYRITLAGYKNYYFPETRIIHYKGESTKRTSLNYVFVFYRAMIIFARKHFSGRHAGIFALLINLAIYLRAGMAVVGRLVKKAMMPLFDSATIYVGMYFLKTYWEENHKWVPGRYPPSYMEIAVPAYIAIWLLSVYFTGGYDRPYRTGNVVRGTAIGTVLISAISNFLDAFRYSKALIVLGGTWATIALLGIRLAAQWLRYRTWTLGERPDKRTVVVGNQQEGRRVWQLLRETNPKADILGYVVPKRAAHPEAGGPLPERTRTAAAPAGTSVVSEVPTEAAERDEGYLGEIRQLREIVEIYKVGEVVFCSKDVSAQQIIAWMSAIGGRVLDYKIVPDDTNYVIGSSSRTSQGDLYTVDVTLDIIQPKNLRNKRVFDLLSSLVMLFLLPVLVWFVKHPSGFVRNLFRVLFGQRSWVGFSRPRSRQLPHLRQGILSPLMGPLHRHYDEATLRRVDQLYAKNYRVSTDLNLVLSHFRWLGRHEQSA